MTATSPQPAQRPSMLLVAHFSADDHLANDRFTDLATRFQSSGFDVELITSSFSHIRKRQRTWDYGPHSFHRTLVQEPGYNKNISFARLRSHRALAQNIASILRTRPIPALVYCAVPSLSVAKAVEIYTTRHNIPLVLDIQDLWPEAFAMTMPNWAPVSGLLRPMTHTADAIYSSADMIVAVSETYAKRASKHQRMPSHVLYLGTDLASFDCLAKTAPSSDSAELRLGYVGTMGHSYDLHVVIEAMAIAASNCPQPVRLIAMGDGPKLSEFRRHAASAGILSTFTGRLPYKEMVPRLTSCDIALNPIVPGAAASVINKVADYAAAGLPVLNTQDHPEYRGLVESYRAGINCRPSDALDLAANLTILARDPSLRLQMGQGNRRLGEELFDRGKTYPEVVRAVHDLISVPLSC